MTPNKDEVLEFGKLFQTNGTYEDQLVKMGKLYGLEKKNWETLTDFHKRIQYYRFNYLPNQ